MLFLLLIYNSTSSVIRIKDTTASENGPSKFAVYNYKTGGLKGIITAYAVN